MTNRPGLKAFEDEVALDPIYGRIKSIIGTVLRAELPGAEIGELCDLRDPSRGRIDIAEVIGVEGDDVILAPYGGVAGLSIRIEVVRTHAPFKVAIGDHLLGALLDGRGRTLRAGPNAHLGASAKRRAITAAAPAALKRQVIDKPVSVGIRAIDGLLTIGRGQRVGLYGSPGTGKSTLVSALVRHVEADAVVVALVGERGREVTEFARHHLSAPGGERLTVVAATSDRPPLERLQAVLLATAIAEQFRDQGRHVLLIVDSVTRLARALREIGLSAGEPPVRRGFPPSTFTTLPQIFERAGPGETGFITAFYTVLVEGEIADDPIAEETRSLLDGHIVLSDKLLSSGWLPAIDVLASRSRTMGAVVSPAHRQAAESLRGMIERYQKLEFLIRLGEYQPGRDAADDRAVGNWARIAAFLRQDILRASRYEDTVSQLNAITDGGA
ncbi:MULTISPECIES: FliI/YscN family ATPase [unclassified Aureimonas]|uniref:FliI/YscN family ATPase n=1 Tax=unclassified Aureimonas TaxID=2615206 RepID=UPI0006F1D051|nr:MULTISPECIES: FliI/YscN family ATPase [unclassified Aureimonas]KQT60036.1 type III secretion apparatus H+-transporting two-sector ATPase [Aureimonas sp. Leaf427]KQT79584.1 type III secretion apparatus H+-transporting two-sector ATPase [Aureimonas sp. Leaf460]